MPELSSTWARYRNPSTDPAKLQAFYRNVCGKGLLETPQGMPAHRLPRYLHGSTQGSVRSAIKEYLFDRWFKQRHFAAQWAAFRAAGVQFPMWRLAYREFYANVQGECFNANLAKDAANYLFLTRGLPHLTVESVCEIGAGYGGFCELLWWNWPMLKTYYIIDLPETLAVAEGYLYARIPWDPAVRVRKLSDLGPAKEMRIYLIGTDFFEAHKAELVQRMKVDLFFNSNSFVEMSRPALASYKEFIEQFNCHLFSSNAGKRMERDSAGEFLNQGIWPKGQLVFQECPAENHQVNIWKIEGGERHE